MDTYKEESKLLFKLLRTKAFRFITIKYNHYSLVEKIKDDLKEYFPERKSKEIDGSKTDYRSLVDSYYELESGFFLIENFDKLLENTEIYPALNQRRDKLAKYPIAIIAFISPSAPKLYAREIMEKMPDLWSFRSFMLDLEKDIQAQEKQTQFSNNQKDTISISSLGGNTATEKQQEIKRLEKLFAENPNDIPLKEVILSQLATLYTDIGEYEKSNELIDKLLEINTDKENEAKLLIDKGDNYKAIGNLEKSLVVFKKSLEISREIEDKTREGIALERVGETNQKLGNLQLALEFFEKYNELEKQLHKEFPNTVEFKNLLAISYSKLGETNQKLGNLQLALEFFEKRKELGEQLYHEFPTNVNFKNGLAISYSKLGQTNQKLGNLQLALEFFEKDLELQEQLYHEFPTNVNFKNGLAISYEKLGSYFKTIKDIEKAKNYYLKARNHYVELTEKFSNYAEFQRNLNWVENQLKQLQ